MLAVTWHLPSNQIGTSFFQETRPEWLFADANGWCQTLTSADQMPRLLRVAIQEALANQSVSVLVVPGDLADEPNTHPSGASTLFVETGRVLPPMPQVQRLADAINAAQSVTLFCGTGVRGAHAEAIALAEALRAPVGHSLRGKEWIQYANP